MMRLRRSLTVGLVAIAAGVAASAAGAAVAPGQAIDGPSNDIVSLGGADMAPDGSGAIAYIKSVGGVDHVFVARRTTAGAWQSPEQVTTGNPNSSSAAQIEVGAGGRVVVTYKTGAGGTELKARVATGGGAFGPAIDINPAVQKYDFDMSEAGVGYFAMTVGADVLAARFEGTTATALAAPLDNDPTKTAGATDVAVAVDATGNAVAAWDEEDVTKEIYARRISGTTPGTVAQATVPSLLGAPASGSSMNVAVDSDDAGNAWVAFRQSFTYPVVNNRNRPLVRRLSGDSFGPTLPVDPGPTPPAPGTDAEFTRVAAARTGETAVASGFIQDINTNMPPAFGATLSPGEAAPFALESAPSEQIGRSGNAVFDDASALIAYQFKPSAADPFALRARLRTGTGAFADSVTLSDPSLGPVSNVTGPEVATDYTKTAIVTYLQGEAADKRILVAELDNPGGGGGQTTAAPVVTNLRVARWMKRTLRLRFQLSRAATVRITILRRSIGRRVGGKCRKRSQANRLRRHCARLVPVETLRRSGSQGLNRITILRRISKNRVLRRGQYRLRLVAITPDGKRSKQLARSFRVVKPRARR